MRKVLLSILGALLATSVATTAHADETTRGTDWGPVLVGLDAYMRHGSESATPQMLVAHERAGHQLYMHNAGNAWFGVAPSVRYPLSFEVARLNMTVDLLFNSRQ